jgi:steroid delta-isomerase-like uncharacterized protein
MEGIELVQRMIAMFNSGRTDEAEAIVTEVYDEHATAPFQRVPPGRVSGPAQLRSTVEWLRAQFPDLSMSIDAIVRENDLIAVRTTSTGTNLGPINGLIPATGRRFAASQSHWFRIRDGKLAEHWATRDDLTGLIQIGLIDVPGAAPAGGAAAG